MVIISQAPAAAQITAATGGVFNAAAGEPGAGSQLPISLPGTGRLEGKAFRVRASGYATFVFAGATTVTVQPLIYAGASGFTAAAANAVFSAAAVNVVATGASTATVPWLAEIEAEGDSVGGKLQGLIKGVVNNTLVDLAPIANPPSSLSFTTEPPLQFAVGVTASADLTALQLDSFVLEA